MDQGKLAQAQCTGIGTNGTGYIGYTGNFARRIFGGEIHGSSRKEGVGRKQNQKQERSSGRQLHGQMLNGLQSQWE